MIAICTNKRRPDVQSNRLRFGSQDFRPDVYHIRGDDGKTICGRKCADWLTIGEIAEMDNNCCAKCKKWIQDWA